LPEPLQLGQSRYLRTWHDACLRRSHERKQFARLDNAIDVREDVLGLLCMPVLDRDCDAFPTEAPDVGVCELCVIASDHLLDVGHFVVAFALCERA